MLRSVRTLPYTSPTFALTPILPGIARNTSRKGSYEALLNKCDALGEIEEIGREELEHFLIINRTIAEIGGDPTVQSPSADVAGVASLGIMQVLTDPRSSMTQCLQAMLTAELTDNAGWELLIKLADNLGREGRVRSRPSA